MSYFFVVLSSSDVTVLLGFNSWLKIPMQAPQTVILRSLWGLPATTCT